MGLFTKKTAPAPGRRLRNADQEPVRATLADLDARYTFRRNRTLTGSLASNVSSVNEHSAELKSPRVHAHHLRRHRRHFMAALFIVLAITTGLAYLIFQSVIQTSVTTSAPRVVNDVSYTTSIQEYLLNHPLERFRFSLNTDTLASYLQAHGYPEIDTISEDVAFNGFGKASLHITFRQPVAVWRTGSTAMYVDSKGNAFERNYYQDPSVQVVDQTGITTENNQVLASNHFLGFIGKVIGRMKEHGFVVTQIALPINTTRQIQLQISGVGYPIKFSIDRPVGEQAEDAARAIRHLANKGIAAQYLDVRVSGRAYYQ